MCPGSHIRRAWGVTPLRASPEVQVPAARPTRSRSVGPGGEQRSGPQHKANAAASLLCPPRAPVGSAQGQLWFWECRACHRKAKASVCGEGIGRVHPQDFPAYGRWHRARDRCRKAGKVSVLAKTRPHDKDPAYNRKTGNRREAWRLAAEAVVVMTARTTQPRSSEGPLGERGRRCWKGLA
jgi:hypothetical protein